MLGRAWTQMLDRTGFAYRAMSRSEFDICDAEAIDATIDSASIVVNCAAYTNVDGAEAEESLATQINGEAPGHLARRCRETDSLLVHYSTDYVFNGCAERPYKVDTPREPLGAYGRSKAAGEIAIEESGCDHLTVRTSWLYAPWGSNFVRTIAKVAAERDDLKVVSDQIGRPGSCEHLASATSKLISSQARGTFHVADAGLCSWFEFAVEIARLTGSNAAINPCTTEDFPRPAPRPPYSVLDVSSTEQQIGPMVDWKINLADVIKRLES